ncbi:MAG: peptide chain release factor N(5)-glutamine methyltransferase [Acidimicrobiales bacterium]|nr:peptide chain release factor N(5)-glutamine methyltransferase [Acidimicrobiales bacterium]
MGNGDGTIAWRELLAEAAARVGERDARRIVEELTDAAPGQLHRELDDLVTERALARFDEMVARRAAGEPLQYVLGRWGFRSLDLMVDRRVLIPRPETEVVAGLAIDAVVARGTERDVLVADLGTGSGAIALAVAAECTAARVLATDASADALAVARANLAGLGRAAARVSLHDGSWFDALPDGLCGSLDVIVSNPPYVADDEDLPAVVGEWEPPGALRAGPDGLDDLHCIVDQSVRWLAADGTLVLEMAPDQTVAIARRCEQRGFVASIHQDLAGRDRAVVATREDAP